MSGHLSVLRKLLVSRSLCLVETVCARQFTVLPLGVDSSPVFTYSLVGLQRFRWEEGATALTPGDHTIVFDFKYDGPGPGKSGTGILSVDGKQVASLCSRRSLHPFVPHDIEMLEWINKFNVHDLCSKGPRQAESLRTEALL